MSNPTQKIYSSLMKLSVRQLALENYSYRPQFWEKKIQGLFKDFKVPFQTYSSYVLPH